MQRIHEKNLMVIRLVLVFLFSLPTFVLADSEMPQYNIPEAPADYLSLTNPYTSEADLKKGESYYQAKCSECHGEKGEGDGESAVIFNHAAYMKTRSDGQLFYILKEGAGEDAEMEGYGVETDYGMSDKKLWQMITYIRTLVQ